ncbi:MAG: amidohydrolase family protein, partial [Clostridia bacterium]|nr:amidohydrolase family protein [Clostridia bacterium]
PVALAKMASTTPARLHGLADRGEIAAGKRADLVLMDKNYALNWVMYNGEIVSAEN